MLTIQFFSYRIRTTVNGLLTFDLDTSKFVKELLQNNFQSKTKGREGSFEKYNLLSPQDTP